MGQFWVQSAVYASGGKGPSRELYCAAQLFLSSLYEEQNPTFIWSPLLAKDW